MKTHVNHGLADTLKANSIRRKLAHVFARRRHDQHPYPDLNPALSRLRKIKFENENILRWEDDGGQLGGWRNQTRSADTFGNEESERQAYKDEYLVNDSLGG
jgi:hypothetical protein